MDTVQEFSNKLKQFDLVNKDVYDTIGQIRNLKSNLINEIDKRIEFKNVY